MYDAAGRGPLLFAFPEKRRAIDVDLMEKLTILGEAARYDASCSSSGSGRQGKAGGIGNACMAGICHTWSADGRCVSLLKILQSNVCAYDCAYCINRRSNDVLRATFTPEEAAKITYEFYRRNYIEGLFLSSAVVGTPDGTMEMMYRTVKLLRENYRFGGYIHVKVIPGADPAQVERMGLLADRVSVNVELPSADSLRLLAPQKRTEAILAPMDAIRALKAQNAEERRRFRSAPLFAPAGQSTQMIVGATPESDRRILKLSEGLYRRYDMKRVYFSAYIPVGVHPALPGPEHKAPLLREHRLYQADWLMRFYGFSADEITGEDDFLAADVDPKCAWALSHRELFPVEINEADYGTLLRIPGVGVRSAKRILAARRTRRLDAEDLRRLGVVMKRAKWFVTCKGRFAGPTAPDDPFLRAHLREGADHFGQTTLIDVGPADAPPADLRPVRKLLEVRA